MNEIKKDKQDQTGVAELAKQAALATTALSAASLDQRNKVIADFATILDKRRAEILAANNEDAQGKSAGEFKSGRMAISNEKIDTVIDGCKTLIAMADPLGVIDYAKKLDDGLNLYRVSCPIGVLGIIFEARPDVLPQIAALALKSGNVVLLKGGQEVEKTNRVLFDCLQQALQMNNLPAGVASLLASRADVATLLTQDKYVDLIVPRGSNALVSYIQANTKIPVLGHAEGICHIYVDSSADIDKAVRVVVDAKVDYAEACNAVETLLLHAELSEEKQIRILKALSGAGVELIVDKKLKTVCDAHEVKAAANTDDNWSIEYGTLVIGVKSVASVEEAIAHINEYGSGHTDSIVCEDQAVWQKFFAAVRSAGVYLNASTRFADGYRYGFGAEVGISTGNLPPRGPVGLEGLVTYKYKLEGDGHIVADYHAGARKFMHTDIK
jgi:glutamate-5-semialdehyde dehydrogenase